MNEKRAYAEELLKYLDRTPTAFQSVDELEKLLRAAGATELCENAEWNVLPGKLYYMKKMGTQIAAFRIGGDPRKTGFRIGAAHHDAPGFRIKSAPSSVDLGYERLLLEQYGGAIVHGWLDRPLGVAGCVYVKDENGGFRAVNVNINKPLLVIPSAAPHIKRGVNESASFSVQNEMRPFFTASADGKTTFLDYVAKEIGTTAENILSYELAPYDVSPACFTGANDEFISVPHLDDCALAHAIVVGLCEAGNDTDNAIALIYDHEEIGSSSDRGARSNTLMQIIDRICEKLGYSAEDKYRTMAASFLLSADQAHATHPSYPALQDPQLKVKLGGGPVLKINYRQSYATSARASAFFKTLCEKEDIPYQTFNNHSDTGGGSTIGPMLSSAYGICTVDIGNPTIAMHAVREFGATDDGFYMKKLFTGFFKGE